MATTQSQKLMKKLGFAPVRDPQAVAENVAKALAIVQKTPAYLELKKKRREKLITPEEFTEGVAKLLDALQRESLGIK